MNEQRHLLDRSRWVCWMLVFSIFFTQTRCVAYRTAPIQKREVQENNYFSTNLSKYRILVDDGVKTYELKAPVIVGDHFAGDLLPITRADYDALYKAKKYKDKRKFKNCVFISTERELMPMSASVTPAVSMISTQINFNEISKVDGYVIDDGETFVRTILVIGLVFVVFLFFLVIITAKSSSNNDGRGSCLFCSDSGDSGGSQSGDSGSGASGGGSGASGDASGDSSGD